MCGHATSARLNGEKKLHFSVGLGFGIGLGLGYDSGHWLTMPTPRMRAQIALQRNVRHWLGLGFGLRLVSWLGFEPEIRTQGPGCDRSLASDFITIYI